MRLGPFLLQEFLDSGAMGEVWRGEHVAQNVPVAIKVITGKHARDPDYVASFRNEVRAVARLDHPGVIMLFDAGEVSSDLEHQTSGRFLAGSPYLVMELASQGSLEKWTEGLNWIDLKRVLQSLLGALSHAHARGVIHRDLKLANVLIGSDLPSRPGLKLTDFGIAHTMRAQNRTGTTENITGTPFYMAPEQFRGHWRDYGPWTDLYALGCVAWELSTGQTPFVGQNFWQTAMQHTRAPLPAFKPRFHVPGDFVRWLARLLQKAPQQRFQEASDAAWSLTKLGDPYDIHINHPSRTLNTGSWPRFEPAEMLQATQPSLDLDETIDAPPGTFPFSPPSPADEKEPREASPDQSPLPVQIPPMPSTWIRHEITGYNQQLIGAGLGLYGMRSVPLVGRGETRDKLWNTLREVAQTGSPRALYLHGTAGHGSSRLARWLCQRAQESGAAQTIHVEHDAQGGDGEDLSRGISSFLRCSGLTTEETLLRLENLLRAEGIDDPYEWRALAALICKDGVEGSDTEPPIRFRNPGERYVLLARVLHRLSAARPIILWADDVHWGEDTLAFFEYFLQRAKRFPSPVLLLMTAHDATGEETRSVGKPLKALLEDARTSNLPTPPLPEHDRLVLIEKLLGLNGQLAGEVAQRTHGSPLFAVQLVGDWVQRGILHPGPHGFELRAGASVELPDNLHQVWEARIQQLLHGLPEEAYAALEVAAALGQHFIQVDWLQVCQKLRFSIPPELPGRLLDQGLAHCINGEWTFSQVLLHESLERTSRKHKRWHILHRACAEVLASMHSKAPGGLDAKRLGRHLLEAKRPAEALVTLLRATRDLIHIGRYRSAAHALNLYEQALKAIPAPEEDPRHGSAWVLRAQIETHLGRPAEAAAWSERARDFAHTYAWNGVLPESLLRLAHARRLQGDTREAAALYLKAMGLFEHNHNSGGMANCFRALAQTRGKHLTRKERQEHFARALNLFRDQGDQLGVADCLRGLGQLEHIANRYDTAETLTKQAMELFKSLGNQLGVGLCLNGLAEMARYRGNLEDAERGYRRALRIHEAIGSTHSTLPRLNLGLILLEKRSFEEAARLLNEGLEELARAGRKSFQGGVHANLLPCAAALKNWPAWDRHYAKASTLLRKTSMHDRDIAWPAEMAGDLALEAGDPLRAQNAYLLALEQWEAIQDTARAEKVRGILEGLTQNT